MRRVLQFRLAGRDMHLPKLIGAFVLVAAFLLFLSAGARMFESWENLLLVKDCVKTAQYDASIMPQCQNMAMDSMNFYVRPDQKELALKQITMALLEPIAVAFFWLAILLVGVLFYRTGNLIVPIEERTLKLKEPRRLLLRKRRKR